MDLGSLTIKDILSKKFGDEKAAKVLSVMQEGIDQKLSVEELQQKAKAVVGQGEGPTVDADTSDISAVGTTSAASTVSIAV